MTISNIGNTNILTVVCDFCFISINQDPLIQCTTCKIDQCIYCFRDNLETKIHKKTHDFRVINYSLKITEDWNILEELLFYNSLDKFGLGNWDNISKSIGTKSEEEVEIFFYKMLNIKNNSISNLKINERTSNPFRSKISIYMNNREDFDVEFMNDYEEIIKDMDFTDSDEEIDIKAKNCILKGYKNIIQMRNYRKDIILKKGLLEINKNKEFEKEMSKYLDIEKYKFLLEYLSVEKYEEFIKGICEEKEVFKDKENKINYQMALSGQELEICKKLEISYEEFGDLKKKFIEMKIFKDTEFYDKINKLCRKDKTKRQEILDFFNLQNYI
ncbi:transcriptional adapter 2 (ADA2) [Vairimorpha necatrix]|uniref:Transcriptional adapter 2 (ADA2) n=1 Tax=Vairimorpha necatrix TaxID=6039 RepID=A0AAX4J8U4_9MICR